MDDKEGQTVITTAYQAHAVFRKDKIGKWYYHSTKHI